MVVSSKKCFRYSAMLIALLLAVLIDRARSQITSLPSVQPSLLPTQLPSLHPSVLPSLLPTQLPSLHPSVLPSLLPTQLPSLHPSVLPSLLPTQLPSVAPSFLPSWQPSLTSSLGPTLAPSISLLPTSTPSITPSGKSPTSSPTKAPTLCDDFDCNNGYCIYDSLDDLPYCKCDNEHYGKHCQFVKMICTLQCGQNGFCEVNHEKGTQKCICTDGWTGEVCETDLNEDNDDLSNAEILLIVSFVVLGFGLSVYVCRRVCRRSSNIDTSFQSANDLELNQGSTGSYTNPTISTGGHVSGDHEIL